MRSGLFAVIFVAGLCVAGAAVAQDGEEPAQPGDASALEACLRSAPEPSVDLGRTCIGVVSQPCMEAGSSSTMEMVRCFQRERHAWGALVDRYVTSLRARETATQIVRLDAYLAESESWIEAHCRYRASLYEGGSLAGLTGEACRTNHLGETAIELHSRLSHYDHR
ncbi:lysozyme inhibitor LprI family protein [Terricaulis silvestris]|uniref:Lysozyme inhibitor LprI-like N-terminal domain-containing protein n=1 Tax=Terricaulis silvestris TaxID=2686094 RepID=A0A6I6N1D4_9CAUL|nr:lysozyme inhibitor LprI family protein [Terricaulis silvestris]QGZ97133.1 hypothetical protein DSM104635_03999 [Terricaulis silvestris]